MQSPDYNSLKSQFEALVSGDWRSPPRLPPFDLILAADVLYEARSLPAVATFFRGHLAPGGEAWLADPSDLLRCA